MTDKDRGLAGRCSPMRRGMASYGIAGGFSPMPSQLRSRRRGMPSDGIINQCEINESDLFPIFMLFATLPVYKLCYARTSTRHSSVSARNLTSPLFLLHLGHHGLDCHEE
jgi:hypothetical protein